MQDNFETIIVHIGIGLVIASIIVGFGEVFLGWQL